MRLNILRCRFLVYSLSIFTGKSIGQNLVPNPSFEFTQGIVCPYISGRSEFNLVVQDWSMPTTGTTDIYQFAIADRSCPLHPISTSVIAFGAETPKDGQNMIGLYAYTGGSVNCPNYKEYAQAELLSNLELGRRYYVGFYSSLADSSRYSANKLGMLFSMDAILSDTCTVLPLIPQVIFEENIEKTNGWVKQATIIESKNSYQYLTIGSFSPDDEIRVKQRRLPLNRIYDASYYYVDSIFVEPIDELFIPSIMTPNGDGANDLFTINGLNSDRWALTIVDRNGKEVFKAERYDNTWDGDNLAAGVYYFLVQYRFDKRIQYAGHLTLFY